MGQVRTTSQQDPSGGIQRPSSLPSFPGYRHPGCPSRVHHERPLRGSPLSTPRERHPRVPQSQYLRGLFHHLLGASPNQRASFRHFFSTHQQNVNGNRLKARSDAPWHIKGIILSGSLRMTGKYK